MNDPLVAVVQPNGLHAIFDTSVNTFHALNLTDPEALLYWKGRLQSHQKAQETLSHARESRPPRDTADKTPWLGSAPPGWQRRWFGALDMVNKKHGPSLVDTYVKETTAVDATGQKDLLLWVDIEVSDLNPDQGKVLEVALALTSSDLVLVDEFVWTLHYSGSIHDPLLESTHQKSGLLKDCLASPLSQQDVHAEATTWLKTRARRPILAGASLSPLTLWLYHWFPGVVHLLSKDCLDLNSLTTALERWGGLRIEPRERTHRALTDVRHLIQYAAVLSGKIAAPKGAPYAHPEQAIKDSR